MALGGLGWLTYLSNPLVNHLSPYNLASGLLGEASVFLWLLVKGRERSTMEGAGQRRMKAAGCRQSGRLHRYRETDPVRMKEKKGMSAAVMTKRFAETSPCFKARMAGVFFCSPC